MTEDEAKAWLQTALDVPRGTMEKIDAFIAVMRDEMPRQNLIAESTFGAVWARHIVDSAQLLTLVPAGLRARWIDLGAGAGFPGIVVALIDPAVHMTLVESRRKRVEFLTAACESLGIAGRVTVIGSRLELVDSEPFDVISARAFAPLERLLPLAHRFSTTQTRWLLPKGRSATSELAAVRGSWQGVFRVEQSVTDPDAAIIVAEKVQPKGRR